MNIIFTLLTLLLFSSNVYAKADKREYVLSVINPKNKIIPKAFQQQFALRKFLHAGNIPHYDSSIPDVVDMRSKDTAVQTQIDSNCTAFGLIAAMENLLEGKVKLSEDHLWSLYKEYDGIPAVKAASTNPITLEKYWPIQKPKDPKYLEYAHHYLEKFVYLEDKLPMALKALAKGSVVYLAFFITDDVADCKAYPSIKSQEIYGGGGHAAVVVGYNQLERTLLIKNSWGEDCGDKGYQHIPYDYCTKDGMYCMLWSIDKVGEKR